MRRPCSPLFAILFLTIQATTVSAAAPHIMLLQGSLLDRPVVMADWQENHTIMRSLREEAAVKDEELAARPYLDVSLFWGPKWLDYKTQGGSVETLSHEQANQKARLYLARGDSPPLLVFQGKAPRSVGPEGVRVLIQHGIPVRFDNQELQDNSLRSMWFAIPTSVLLVAALMLIRVRRGRHSAVIKNVAAQRSR
jgi:hypothetical protein